MSEVISKQERAGWIDPSAPPPWDPNMLPEVWGQMPEQSRVQAVDDYMDRNDIILQGEEEEEEPTYLGGYVAPIEARPGTLFNPPRTDAYMAGDEYNLFTNRSSVFIANLQDRMINAGLIAEDKVYRFGQWTSYEAKAMRSVLALANETGTLWSEVINTYKDKRAESDGGTGGGLPVKVVENEDELTSRLQASLPGLLGGNFLPESDARAIARAYRDYASGKADEAARGGTVEQAMSFNTFVEQQEGIEEGATANRFALLAGALGQLVR
jgi:hypothetical protein